ncbi:MAG: DUF1223 domain-containing protein [Hyphomicrobiaceae bacterium]
MAGLTGTHGGLTPASAQEQRVSALTQPKVKAVLELYTSQGCSSCPPADVLLESYTKRADIVALSFSVDYWDYLGWKDTLANPKFTARQKYYAKHRGDGRVYTPQVVVNGLSHAVGNSAREIDQAIEATQKAFAKSQVPVSVRMEAERLIIEAGAATVGDGAQDATIWLAVIQPVVEVAVRSGENRGKSLRYHNVVREMTPVGMWSGKALTVRLDRDTVKLPETDSAAVIIQAGKAGPILGAAMIPKL